MVAKFRKDNTKEAVDFLVRFAELIHTLMYLHPGFPDLYDPVLTALEVQYLTPHSHRQRNAVRPVT